MEGTLNIRKSDTEMSVREISKESPEYPQKLLHYEGMPEILYVRGTLPDPRRPAVAIVGARAASPYGRMQAFRYARRLSEEGVQILSGMAYGIDTEAHRGALEGEGGTWAVLGNGVDICYPSGNRVSLLRCNEPLHVKGITISEGLVSDTPIYHPWFSTRRLFRNLQPMA